MGIESHIHRTAHNLCVHEFSIIEEAGKIAENACRIVMDKYPDLPDDIDPKFIEDIDIREITEKAVVSLLSGEEEIQEAANSKDNLVRINSLNLNITAGRPNFDQILPKMMEYISSEDIMPEDRTPFPYQTEKLQKMLTLVSTALGDNDRKMVHDITPVSWGKNQMATMLAKAALMCGLRVVWATTGRSVIEWEDGSRKTFEHVIDPELIGEYRATVKEVKKPLILTSHTSLRSKQMVQNIWGGENGTPPAVVILDEADLFQTQLSQEKMTEIEELAGFRPIFAWFTATEKIWGKDLRDISHRSDKMELYELIQMGRAKHILWHYVQVDADLTKDDLARTKDGWELSSSTSWARMFRHKSIKTSIEIFKQFHAWDSCLFMCSYIDDAKKVEEELKNIEGVTVQLFTWEQTNESDKILEKYTDSTGASIISATKVMGRGTSDGGKTNVIFSIGLTSSEAKFVQELGRWMRIDPSNQEPQFLKVYQTLPSQMQEIANPVLLEQLFPEGTLATPNEEWTPAPVFESPDELAAHITDLLQKNPDAPFVGAAWFRLKVKSNCPKASESKWVKSEDWNNAQEENNEIIFLDPKKVQKVIDTWKTISTEKLVINHFREIMEGFGEQNISEDAKWNSQITNFLIWKGTAKLSVKDLEGDETSITVWLFVKNVVIHCLKEWKIVDRDWNRLHIGDIPQSSTAGARLAKIWYYTWEMPSADIIKSVIETQYARNYLAKVISSQYKEITLSFLEQYDLTIDQLTATTPKPTDKIVFYAFWEPIEITYRMFYRNFFTGIVGQHTKFDPIAVKYLKLAYEEGLENLNAEDAIKDIKKKVTPKEIDKLVDDHFDKIVQLFIESFDDYNSISDIWNNYTGREIEFNWKIITWWNVLSSCFVLITSKKRSEYKPYMWLARKIAVYWYETWSRPNEEILWEMEREHEQKRKIADLPLEERHKLACEVLSKNGIQTRLDLILLTNRKFFQLDFWDFWIYKTFLTLLKSSRSTSAIGIPNVADILGYPSVNQNIFRERLLQDIEKLRLTEKCRSKAINVNEFSWLKFWSYRGNKIYDMYLQIVEKEKWLLTEEDLDEFMNFLFS